MRTALLHLDDLRADLHLSCTRAGDRTACRSEPAPGLETSPRDVGSCSWDISRSLRGVETSPHPLEISPRLLSNSPRGMENFPRGVEMSPGSLSNSLRGVES